MDNMVSYTVFVLYSFMFSFNFFAAQRAYARKGEIAAAPLDGPVETYVSAVKSHLFFCYQQLLQSYSFFCKLQKKKENNFEV